MKRGKYNIEGSVNTISLVFVILCAIQISCKNFVEVAPPVTSVNEANVYASDATAIAVLTGIYAQLAQGSFISGTGSVTLYAGLSADELTVLTNTVELKYVAHYRNALSNTVSQNFWEELYKIIYKANDAIEGVVGSESLSSNVKRQLIGEAKLVRAFCYFYLINLYGDVPLIIGTDYTKNAVVARLPVREVYNQIITDLIEAKDLLSENYVGGDVVSITAEKVRPNKWVATALLARVYLYTKDYDKAESQATEIINSSIYDTVSLNSVFLRNSKEAIWQLQPVTAGKNTLDAIMFILPESGPDVYNHNFFLSEFQLNSFESNDLRRRNWIDSVKAGDKVYYYPYKYKVNTSGAPITEYQILLRLAEQYLIRAEARAHQGDVIGAREDVNIIRRRAGLYNINVATKDGLLIAIEQERRAELFTEFGHRWLDLKRTHRVNVVMSQITPLKGNVWSENWQLYPISIHELEKNASLIQNAGY